MKIMTGGTGPEGMRGKFRVVLKIMTMWGCVKRSQMVLTRSGCVFPFPSRLAIACTMTKGTLLWIHNARSTLTGGRKLLCSTSHQACCCLDTQQMGQMLISQSRRAYLSCCVMGILVGKRDKDGDKARQATKRVSETREQTLHSAE